MRGANEGTNSLGKFPDYARIAEINALAFAGYNQPPLGSTYRPDVTLVDGLRHGADFDPQLSLVAQVDGNVVGHVFLSVPGHYLW